MNLKKQFFKLSLILITTLALTSCSHSTEDTNDKSSVVSTNSINQQNTSKIKINSENIIENSKESSEINNPQNDSVETNKNTSDVSYNIISSMLNSIDKTSGKFSDFYYMSYLSKGIKELTKNKVSIDEVNTQVQKWKNEKNIDTGKIISKISEGKSKIMQLLNGNNGIINKINMLGLDIKNSITNLNYDNNTFISYFKSIINGLK